MNINQIEDLVENWLIRDGYSKEQAQTLLNNAAIGWYKMQEDSCELKKGDTVFYVLYYVWNKGNHVSDYFCIKNGKLISKGKSIQAQEAA